jgi:predicted ATPase/class 3 adenylate cyclase/predicted negative regulator of RcsB-dependent stress response
VKQSSSGTVTLVFTDIEGSTRLIQALGARYADVLATHNRILRGAFEEHGGTELSSAGDGLYFSFQSARAALAATVAGQRALATEEWPPGAAVKVRIGLHTGEPISSEAGLVGVDVHRAARISQAGHGGQILVSNTTRDLVANELPAGVALVDLGQHALKDLAGPQRIYQVAADGLQTAFPPLRSLDSRPNNLPRQMTSFVGRADDLLSARQMIVSAPMVTVTGPGGVGKTRFAVQVCVETLDKFEEGVWMIELGALADPDLVPQSVAAALGISERSGLSVDDALVEHVSGRQMLLLLDNCEHLLDACANIAYRLLSKSPFLRIIATSREPLGIAGESQLQLAPLATPDPATVRRADEALASDAVRLFLDRALAVHPGFALTDRNASAVCQITQRLDGIPLAIELAAARVRALPVDQIAERLSDRFRLLTGGNRLAVSRHQTLRATIDWSYDLLSEQERTVLRRLSVFAGGMSLDAAEQICSASSIARDDVFELLARLVDKSLLALDESGSTSRYRILEMVRQYAREQLLESNEAEEAFERHRDWYLELVERSKPNFFRGVDPLDTLAEFDREHDNLRAALEWSAAEPAGAGPGLRMAAGLWRYWEIRGFLVEGGRWLERTLSATDGEVSSLRANTLTGAGILASMQGDWRAAFAYHSESLNQHRQLGNANSVAYASNNLANVALELNDLERARELYEQALAIVRQARDERGAAIALINLGNVVSRQGEHDEARRLFDESVTIFERFGDSWGVAFALDSAALAAKRAGDTERARSLHEQSMQLSRQIGDERGVARTLTHLADLAAEQDDLARAKALHRECLRIRQSLRDMPGIASAMEKLAWVLLTEAAEDAARLLGSAEALREAIDAPVPATARADYERYVRTLTARLGTDLFESARLAGRSMAPEQALASLPP